MKIIHLSYSDIIGGASIAAYRLHHSLIKKGVKSNMWVNKLVSDDWTIKDPVSKLEKLFNELKPRLVNKFSNYILKIDNKTIHSPSFLPSAWVKRINESDADIVNLHWIQNEMLSIKDISKINKPIVWTLHDMWAFCGSEHYTDDFRWRTGYTNNRPNGEIGFDLNYWAWRRKQKYWKKPMKIITPSKWLSRCVSESNLMSRCSVTTIANPINIESFKPTNKKIARNQLNLPIEKELILFSAPGGEKDTRKGFDLLLSALKRLKVSNQHNNLELVVIGQSRPKLVSDNNFPIHYMGRLHDDISLCLVYNSVDAIIIPSRQDNLPNTGVEAQACGVPIVSFNVGGLSDIIGHKKTGYLAKAFDISDLANGISWVLVNSINMNLRDNARKNSVLKFSETKVAEKYIEIYRELLLK